MASSDTNKSPLKQLPLNVPVHVECTTIRNVLASAMEAELGALFVHWQRGAVTRMTLIKMDHGQPPTSAVPDSSTVDEFNNDNIRQWHSRTIGMLFYWVRDRVRQGKFLVYCVAREHNLAEYFTKHHPTIHHRSQRSTYPVPVLYDSKYACYMSHIDL